MQFIRALYTADAHGVTLNLKLLLLVASQQPYPAGLHVSLCLNAGQFMFLVFCSLVF